MFRLIILSIVFLGSTVPSQAQFIPGTDRRQGVILEGNWQSCLEEGLYNEKVYDGKWSGIKDFEFHMGPKYQFALFLGIQNDHRDHNSFENILEPYDLVPNNGQASYIWLVNQMRIEVRLAGGSRSDCESWYILITRSELKPKSR